VERTRKDTRDLSAHEAGDGVDLGCSLFHS
jgi:hypothetical protein